MVPTESFDLRSLWVPVAATGEASANASESSSYADVTCELDLNRTRFQSVNTLSLFVVGSMEEDSDTSALRLLTIVGARVHRVIRMAGVL